jgi:hypothetical protein
VMDQMPVGRRAAMDQVNLSSLTGMKAGLLALVIH